MKTTKRCFVISPIGEEGSVEREHADDVFDYIIKPAMDECGIKAFRSDHIVEPGLISNQMYDAILNFDMCVAVLTFKNPNVYYELAIAQAANKPVIILLQKGDQLPFDIKDLRCVFYDLKPRNLFEKVYISQIIDYIKSLESVNWKISSQIPGLSSITQSDEYEFFEMAQNFGKHLDWGNVIKITEDNFYLMGLNLDGWKRIADFEDTLLDKAQGGTKIKILLMHSENPSLRHIINENLSGVSYDDICYVINKNFKFFSDIANKSENIQVKQVLTGCIKNTEAINDIYALYMPHFYSERGGYSPLWKCKRDTYLYKLLLKEFNTLWEVNS